MKAVYYVQTRTKNGTKNYGKSIATKERAMAKLEQYESKKRWARLIEYYGVFPIVIEQTSQALLEQTVFIRDSYKNDPKHQKGIDACNKHIAELQEKLK